MQKFRYNVINKDNKQLTGVINAPDEKSAREELNQLGFSIVNIQAFSAEEKNEGATVDGTLPNITSFEFSAIDKNLKKVVGTIQALDRYNAFKRLMNEYLFEVEYLVDAGIGATEKKTAMEKGIYELQNQYNEEELAQKKTGSKENFDFKAFTEKQQVLLEQVEFVLSKVKTTLDFYEKEINPETKEKIRRYVDKILRIKNSTNLDYIRKTCEELLNFLQKEELFLHEEEKQTEHAKLALEAKSMIMQLHAKKEPGSDDIFEQMRNWRKVHIIGNKQPSTLEKILNFLIGLVIGFHEENEETAILRAKIHTVHQQIGEYIVLYFQAKTPEFKIEAGEALKKLFQERKRLKKELKAEKHRHKLEFKNRADSTIVENFTAEILSFSGWLLGFYLLYYFLSFYFINKDFGTLHFPQNLSFYNSHFLKYFLTVLFLFHDSLSVKINFFRRNEIATIVLVPIFLLSSALILLNF